MPSTDFFASLGVLVIGGLVPSRDLRRVHRGMLQAPGRPATIERDGRAMVDPNVRSTRIVEPAADVRRLVEPELRRLRPRLEAFFGLELPHLQLEYLLYGRGGRYRPHRDAGGRQARRSVSFVLFVNGPERRSYRGGALVLYELLGAQEPWRGCRFSVPAATGTFVAFRSDVLHEVEPVTSGRRCTVTGWFKAAPTAAAR